MISDTCIHQFIECDKIQYKYKTAIGAGAAVFRFMASTSLAHYEWALEVLAFQLYKTEYFYLNKCDCKKNIFT